MSLSDVAQELIDEFTKVYRSTMEERLAANRFEVSTEIDDAITEGGRWLEDELISLLSLPYPDQRRSPLEVFQDAARFPTAALSAAGESMVKRDHMKESALPGDIYDLAPASSQELTPEAWKSHLAWGAEKAQTMTRRVRRPLAGLYTRNLMDRSKIEEELRAAGFDPFLLRNPELVERAMQGKKPVVAFVDLESPATDEIIRLLAAGGVRVIVYGPHVDDLGLQRALSVGASDALPRSRFFGRIVDYLPQLI